ncbi:MAG TPA: hypothetical protein VF576_10025, partial [Rubricoccaceae bacterium]
IEDPGLRDASLEAVAGAERVRAQDNPLRDLSLYGHGSLGRPGGVEVRFGGGAHRRHASATSTTPADAFARRPFAREGLSEQTVDGASAFVGVERAALPAGITGRARVSFESTASVLHPGAFSGDVADALRYGDIDADANAVARRYFVFTGTEYVRQYASDGGASPSARGPVGFSRPGARASVYDRQTASSVQASGSLAGRVGGHRPEVGGEVEVQTFRRFTLAGATLAAYAADGDAQAVPGFPAGVARYDQLDFETLRSLVAGYGYTFNGTEAASGESVAGYFDRTETDVAPFRPLTAAGYVRDRFDAGPATVDVGLRVDLYDARATTLFDPYAVVPILRAGDLSSAPSSVGDDFAVYRGPSGQTVGYRDRDGQFYDAAGSPSTPDEVLNDRLGQAVETGGDASEAFAPTEATVQIQPRLGVRFRATDAVVVSGYAVRLSRRPDPSLYVPFTAYDQLAGFETVPGSAALRPETVDAAGLGVEVAAAPRLTLGATAFVRQYRRVPVLQTFVGGLPAYRGVADVGERDEAGVDLQADLGRTRGVAVHAAYSLTAAGGDGGTRGTHHAL